MEKIDSSSAVLRIHVRATLPPLSYGPKVPSTQRLLTKQSTFPAAEAFSRASKVLSQPALLVDVGGGNAGVTRAVNSAGSSENKARGFNRLLEDLRNSGAVGSEDVPELEIDAVPPE